MRGTLMVKPKRIVAKLLIPKENSNIDYDEYLIDDNLLSAYFEDLDRGSIDDLINFGIYVNKGSVEFIDTLGIYDILKSKNSLAEIIVEFYLCKNNISKLLRTLIADTFEYDKNTKVIKMNLTSRIIQWQEIKIPLIFMYNENNEIPLYTLIQEINLSLPDNLKLNPYGDGATDITIYCPCIEPTTAWDIFSKICVFCGGRIYEDANGKPYLSSMFYTPSGTIIIEPKDILSISGDSFNGENKSLYRNPLSISEKNWLKQKDGEFAKINYTIYDHTPNIDEEYTEYVGNLPTYNPDVTVTRLNDTQSRITFIVKPNFRVYEPKNLSTIAELFKYDFSLDEQVTENRVSISSTQKDISFENNKEDNTIKITLTITSKDNETVFSEKEGITYYFKRYVMKATTYGFGSIVYSGKDDVIRTFTEVPFPESLPHELPTNELFQFRNFYGEDKNSSYSQVYLKKVHDELNKETLECECLSTDYYDTDGNLSLPSNSNNLSFFSRNRLVSPYIMYKGNKVPYNENNNNFAIMGVKYSYKGILKQTLYLKTASEIT